MLNVALRHVVADPSAPVTSASVRSARRRRMRSFAIHITTAPVSNANSTQSAPAHTNWAVDLRPDVGQGNRAPRGRGSMGLLEACAGEGADHRGDDLGFRQRDKMMKLGNRLRLQIEYFVLRPLFI
jgi:hypothetical protein